MPRRRFVLLSHGSTGDLIPMIEWGARAVAEGHEGILLAGEYWWPLAESHGLRVRRIPPYGGKEEHAAFMRRFSPIGNKRQLLGSMYAEIGGWLDQILPVLTEALDGADALLCSSLFPFYRAVARERGVPTVAVHFCPHTFASAEVPAAEIPPLPGWMPSALRRVYTRSLMALADRVLTPDLNRRLGRPELAMDSWIRRPAEFSLYLAPRALFVPPGESLPPHVAFTGFLSGGMGAEAVAEDRLSLPVEGAPLVNFGSVNHPDLPGQFEELYAAWPAGRPLLVQAGWLEPPLPAPGSGIHRIGPASHGDLLPRVSALVHHGGAGTTVSALRAGIPQVIVPHFADQGFWARTVERLGVGRALPRARWGRSLPGSLETLRGQEDRAERAAALGAELRAAPDGAACALRQVEEWLSAGIPAGPPAAAT